MTCCGRREVLAASGLVASAALVSGCGGGEDDGGVAAPATDGGAVVPVGDVPVGGGLVVQAEQLVVTQPVEGEFLAFSAICPHQGCLVTEVRDGEIVCPCHGSRFTVATGEVVGGPAPRGLEQRQVVVDGDEITVS
jgi:Rieske Fe-S protein